MRTISSWALPALAIICLYTKITSARSVLRMSTIPTPLPSSQPTSASINPKPRVGTKFQDEDEQRDAEHRSLESRDEGFHYPYPHNGSDPYTTGPNPGDKASDGWSYPYPKSMMSAGNSIHVRDYVPAPLATAAPNPSNTPTHPPSSEGDEHGEPLDASLEHKGSGGRSGSGGVVLVGGEQSDDHHTSNAARTQGHPTSRLATIVVAILSLSLTNQNTLLPFLPPFAFANHAFASSLRPIPSVPSTLRTYWATATSTISTHGTRNSLARTHDVESSHVHPKIVGRSLKPGRDSTTTKSGAPQVRGQPTNLFATALSISLISANPFFSLVPFAFVGYAFAAPPLWTDDEGATFAASATTSRFTTFYKKARRHEETNENATNSTSTDHTPSKTEGSSKGLHQDIDDAAIPSLHIGVVTTPLVTTEIRTIIPFDASSSIEVPMPGITNTVITTTATTTQPHVIQVTFTRTTFIKPGVGLPTRTSNTDITSSAKPEKSHSKARSVDCENKSEPVVGAENARVSIKPGMSEISEIPSAPGEY